MFIKNSHYPPMYVTSLADYSEKTVFLVYDPNGPGHYDAALPYSYINDHSSRIVQSVISHDQAFCRCGVNKANPITSCAPNPTYASQCICYRSSKPCNSQCNCKNCCNPCGAKPSD